MLTTTEPKFISSIEACGRLGISRSALWAYAGRRLRPVYLTPRKAVWDVAEISKLGEELKQRRELYGV